jgi:hypothetical protein
LKWVEDINVLKQQLRQQLEAVETYERVASEASRPQTLEQLDDVEKRLTGALEEVKARRSELQKSQKK